MSGMTRDYENVKLSGNISKDIALFSEIFAKEAVFRKKEIKVAALQGLNCALLYFDGMVNSVHLNDAVIRPLVTIEPRNNCVMISEYIEKQVLFACNVKKETVVSNMLQSIMYGEALLLIDTSETAIIIDAKGFQTRGINEPQEERVLQGPREGFEEVALRNLAMIRRRLQTPDLCTEMMRVGRRSGTAVFVCYLATLADSKLVAELKRRIAAIDIDGIMDTNYITEKICKRRFSIFKTSGTTERPDVVAARLLEGRVALVVDGTPMVLTLPYLFSENFQSDEDYYLNFLVSSVGRILRYISFFLAISIPGIFIAISTFHRELLPTGLAISVSSLRGGVPFSPLTECLIMIFVFEILQETGIRMPQSLGHALSIVGGLVVGQAAVEARIISTPMLIVIALSGISGLMIPRLRGAVLYLRLIFVLLSAFLGLFGYFIGISVMVMHIISLDSFGVDYTVSLRKADLQSLKDTFWRASWRDMIRRPQFNRNIIRSRRAQK